jgi:hypothetical protein
MACRTTITLSRALDAAAESDALIAAASGIAVSRPQPAVNAQIATTIV